jgi:hypothetical protein
LSSTLRITTPKPDLRSADDNELAAALDNTTLSPTTICCASVQYGPRCAPETGGGIGMSCSISIDGMDMRESPGYQVDS